MKRLLMLSIALLAAMAAGARIPHGMAIGSTATASWVNVTPAVISLDNNYSCTQCNFGIETVGADTGNAGTLYFMAHMQGLWKSTDYGVTWTGPINTGTNGANVTNCGGGITVVPNGATPVLWEACIRGASGLWKSTDGGINWTSIADVPPLPSGRPDVYPVVADPYNVNHILVAGHEQNFLLETTNGGTSWNSITLPAGMLENGGTQFVFFINTGSSVTTAKTWLVLNQQVGGTYGTWRTTDQGVTWTQVDKNEHPHGASQIYQPATSGVLYMGGAYSNLGWGVLRSTDYGATWTHMGNTNNASVVFGSATKVYSMYGYSDTSQQAPNFQSAPQPGTPSSSWAAATGAPATFSGGPHTIATVNDGTHTIFIGAMGLSGVWRYVEP